MSGRRILVVEDEGLVAMMIEDLLEELGHQVAFSAATVPQALDWLQAGGEADAALLDVDLGGQPVFPVAEALKAKGVPYAFSTGYGEAHDPRLRDAPLLGKPIMPGRLAQVLKALGCGD